MCGLVQELGVAGFLKNVTVNQVERAMMDRSLCWWCHAHSMRCLRIYPVNSSNMSPLDLNCEYIRTTLFSIICL